MSKKSPVAFRCLESCNAEFTEAGLYSGKYSDVYHSRSGAVAEGRHVFITGNNLPERFAASPHRFVLAELGFGTGLNFCLAWDAWRDHAPSGAHLHYLAWEAHPLEARVMLKFLEGKVASSLARKLCTSLPLQWPGWHNLYLSPSVTLTLAYEDVAGLADASFAADAWFLDGFAPSRNSAIWTADVLAQVFRLSMPGGTATAYTTAGHVRHNLSVAGFEVTRRPGFGCKREMTHAVRLGENRSVLVPLPRKVGVIGAGIAGHTVAAALSRRGLAATMLAPATAAFASTNPAVLLTPRPTVGDTSLGYLGIVAFAHTHRLVQTKMDSQSVGALLLASSAREQLRQERLARQQWPTDMHVHLDAGQASERAGLQVGSAGLWLPLAGLFAGVDLVSKLGHFEVERVVTSVEALRPEDGGWQLITADGVLSFDAVILACGMAIGQLAPDGLKLRPLAGGLVAVPATAVSQQLNLPLLFGGCLLPARNGVHLLTQEASLPRAVASGLTGDRGKAIWSGVRCKTTDHLPLAGFLADNLLVLGGLGSRGFTQAPLLAELVVAQLLDEPLPLPRRLVAAVAPGPTRQQWG